MKRLLFFALLVAGPIAISISIGAQQAPADIILTNGKIITVDAQFSIAQAVAVRGGRFVRVGTNQEVNRLAGPNTRRIDLRGRAVVPGLIDN
ncbi:MAG: amidohydrolase, partial [Acidobacteria bacterium]|nr:amidohydrolase [Acidobacteriota bacterium]